MMAVHMDVLREERVQFFGLLLQRPPTEPEMRAWENALAASDEYFDAVGSDAPCPSCMVRALHLVDRRRPAR
jgi:hypothetical protein